MKYFTKKLWEQMNEGSEEIAYTLKQWEKNKKAYWRYVDSILPKLPKKAQHFLKKVELHDSILLSFSTGDVLKCTNDSMLSTKNYVKLDVLHPRLDFVYSLHYSKVRKCIVDYANRDVESTQWRWDDWGYDEFGLTKDKWMRHEILFASGATILLEFKSFSYGRKKFKRADRKHYSLILIPTMLIFL